MFSSSRDGGLYAINPDGTGLRELVKSAHGGRWSPDGTKLLYSRGDTTYVAAVGGATHRLPQGQDWAWSPDSQMLAYDTGTCCEGGNVALVQADGSGRRLLTRGDNSFSAPAWSPDGTKIAFTSSDENSPRGCTKNWVDSLYVVGVAGGKPKRLAVDADSPSWSPEGTEIAFTHDGFCGAKSMIGAVGPDGTGSRTVVLTGGQPQGVAWSPDGRRIAYMDDGRASFDPAGYIVATTGGTPTRIVHHEGFPLDFSWSPDSTTVAMTLEEGAPTRHDVWLSGLDGRPPRPLTPGAQYGYSNDDPQWHPLGRPASALGGTPVAPTIPTDSVVHGDTLLATHRISYLAADGTRVAVAYPGALNCLEVWNTTSPTIVRYAASSCADPDVLETSLAGTRVAWLAYDQGIHVYFDLYTSTPARPAPVDASSLYDDYEADLAGDSSLLVFDEWAQWRTLGGKAYKAAGALLKIDGSRAVRIRSESGGLTVLSVDGGRIAVERSDGPIEIVGASGTLERTLPFPRDAVHAAALTGTTLAVDEGPAVAVYDITTGKLEHTWPKPSSEKLTDAAGGIAITLAGRTIHLLKLSDGLSTTLTPPGSGGTHAQIEPAGLYYSYTLPGNPRPGRVAFVPMRTVLRLGPQRPA
jgi:Tol biopolymer transport system component